MQRFQRKGAVEAVGIRFKVLRHLLRHPNPPASLLVKIAVAAGTAGQKGYHRAVLFCRQYGIDRIPVPGVCQLDAPSHNPCRPQHVFDLVVQIFDLFWNLSDFYMEIFQNCFDGTLGFLNAVFHLLSAR